VVSVGDAVAAAGEVDVAGKTPSSGLTATFSPFDGEKGQEAIVGEGMKAAWLAPIALEPLSENLHGGPIARRASSLGCLPMTLDQYLSLLDWTGRQIRKDKVGNIPGEFDPILERLECSAESWLDLVKNFRKRFRTEAGLAKSVLSFRSGRHARRQSPASA